MTSKTVYLIIIIPMIIGLGITIFIGSLEFISVISLSIILVGELLSLI